MKSITVEPLALESFEPFGSFADLLNPRAKAFHPPPVEFFPDRIVQMLDANGIVSFSCCRVSPREPIIDVSEYHNQTAEMMMPLDGDTTMHFAPANPPSAGFPSGEVRVFFVPRGTMVVIRPGTWHHAPFCTATKPVNVLVSLPPRTYALDCFPLVLEGDQRLRIAGL